MRPMILSVLTNRFIWNEIRNQTWLTADEFLSMKLLDRDAKPARLPTELNISMYYKYQLEKIIYGYTNTYFRWKVRIFFPRLYI